MCAGLYLSVTLRFIHGVRDVRASQCAQSDIPSGKRACVEGEENGASGLAEIRRLSLAMHSASGPHVVTASAPAGDNSQDERNAHLAPKRVDGVQRPQQLMSQKLSEQTTHKNGNVVNANHLVGDCDKLLGW